MRGRVVVSVVLGLALALAGGSAFAQPGEPSVMAVDYDPQGNAYVAGELIVTYEEQVSARTAEGTGARVGAEVEAEIPEVDAEALSFPEVEEIGSREEREAALADKKDELRRQPGVESVSYNYLLQTQTDDYFYDLQWNLQRIKAPQAWTTATGVNARIAIVDNGIENSHPDLSGRVVSEHDYVEGDGVAQPSDTGDPARSSHATHIAGIAAASTDNGKGIASVAPGARLMDYKIVGPNGATFANAAQAVIDAADDGAGVINMSFGASVGAPVLENAVNHAWKEGAVLTASAGNDYQNGNPPNYPSGYQNVIAVGAVNKANTRSNFSRVGPDVDVVAPGGSTAAGTPDADEIISTLPYYFWPYTGCHNEPDCYGFYSGTSQAAPHVAGLAALLDSQGLTNAQIRQRIESTATDLGTNGRDNSYGHGLVNAQAAVNAPNPAPRVTAVTPRHRATGVSQRSNATATFSEAMDRSTVGTTTFTLRRKGTSTALAATVSYDPTTRKATLDPEARLKRGATYVATVTTGVKNAQGTALSADEVWSFTTKR